VRRVDPLDLEGEVAEPLENREQVCLIDHADHDRGRRVSRLDVGMADGYPRLSPSVETKCSPSSPRTTISYITRFDVLGTLALEVIETSMAQLRPVNCRVGRVRPG
jgi:hypothetical protein